MQSGAIGGHIDINFQCVGRGAGQYSTQAGRKPVGNSRRTTALSWLRSAQFTADGTTLIAHDDANSLQTFVLPQDLLEAGEKDLRAHASIAFPTNLLSYAAHPYYNLQDTSTTWVLAGATDMPTQLRNALDYTFSTTSYPWTNPNTEAFQGAYSLAFTNDGTRFVSGSRGALGIFDLKRPGQAPTVRRRSGFATLSRPQRELIMALAVSDDGLIAAGTSNRDITIWSESGVGEEISSFSLKPLPGSHDVCSGTGVTSLQWSPCQRYLLVAERQSDHIQVFDVRKGGHRIAMLSGRRAYSTQKFDIAAISTYNGSEVWAGGVDGSVKMWSHVGDLEGEQYPDVVRKLQNRPMGGISWHPQNAVLASTAGGFLPASQTVSSNSGSSSDESDVDEDHDQHKEPISETVQTLNIWRPH